MQRAFLLLILLASTLISTSLSAMDQKTNVAPKKILENIQMGWNLMSYHAFQALQLCPSLSENMKTYFKRIQEIATDELNNTSNKELPQRLDEYRTCTTRTNKFNFIMKLFTKDDLTILNETLLKSQLEKDLEIHNSRKYASKEYESYAERCYLLGLLRELHREKHQNDYKATVLKKAFFEGKDALAENEVHMLTEFKQQLNIQLGNNRFKPSNTPLVDESNLIDFPIFIRWLNGQCDKDNFLKKEDK